MSSRRLIKGELVAIAREQYIKNDPSHDINHALRVLSLCEKIGKTENADMDVLVPAAIFHDIINYPKNHPKRCRSSIESADFAKKILRHINSFPQNKVNKIYEAIKLCSFTKGIVPDFLEAKILQDADSLEAMGAISIMRTFCSTGVMNRAFYDSSDPFCRKRKPNDTKFALDLFFTRLLVVQRRLHTKAAKSMAKRRVKFLKSFLAEFEFELAENI